jgi:hypothetical protein
MPQAPIVIQNTPPTQPSTTYGLIKWVDTSTSPATKRVRNNANNAWVAVGTMDSNAPLAAPTFTRSDQEWVDISASPATKRVRNNANNAWL